MEHTVTLTENEVSIVKQLLHEAVGQQEDYVREYWEDSLMTTEADKQEITAYIESVEGIIRKLGA